MKQPSLDIDFEFQPVFKGQLLKRSFAVFFANIKMITLIVMSVYLPAELAKNYWLHTSYREQELTFVMQIENILSMILGALVAPAVIFSVIELLRTGRPAKLFHLVGLPEVAPYFG